MIKMLSWIKICWLKLRKKVEVYPVSKPEIENLLNRKFKNCFIEIEDIRYLTCDYKTAKILSLLIPTRILKYKKEEWDCDNFSKLFWALTGALFPRLPVGKCNVKTNHGLHALNFIIYRTKRRLSFSFIEPQTGKLSYWNYRPYLIIV